MMLEIPSNVREVLLQLVPANILNRTSCFVFYDNHPRDERNIDITLCTNIGEVMELCSGEVLCSIQIEVSQQPAEIRILRNEKCELFYLLFGGDELIILSRKDRLQIQRKLTDVSRYEISDTACSGQSTLKVHVNGNFVPLVADENYDNFEQPESSPSFSDSPMNNCETTVNDGMPIVKHLSRKLTETKYIVTCNEQTYKDFLNIRQSVAFSMYKKINPNLDDSLFKDGMEKMRSTLKIDTQEPWIRTCNMKIIIVYPIENRNTEPLEDAHILLHGTTKQTIEYTTKIFEETENPPFFIEAKTQTLKPNVKYSMVVVINLEEMKQNILSKIEFNGAILYKKCGAEYVLPIDDVKLSTLDTMGKQFDVLSCDPVDNYTILAVLASTEKTDLLLRHIKINSSSEQPDVSEDFGLNMFCKYLHMEHIPHIDNIVIHRKSPYHVLNGVMVILHSSERRSQLAVTVHSRTPSQVLALIHHIHNTVPFMVVTTTPTQILTAKSDTLSIDNDTEGDDQPVYNYMDYASSILNRTDLILEYLNNSTLQMCESKSTEIQNKIGREIDLFAQGESCFKEFRRKMWDEAAKGAKMLNENSVSVPDSDAMCVD